MFFFSNFCHHYHQNYQYFDQNYHGNDYYHHQYFFPPYAQNVVFVGRKKSVKLPELGGGGGVGGFGQCPNSKVFIVWTSSLTKSCQKLQELAKSCKKMRKKRKKLSKVAKTGKKLQNIAKILLSFIAELGSTELHLVLHDSTGLNLAPLGSY